jgi:hypothetical protein
MLAGMFSCWALGGATAVVILRCLEAGSVDGAIWVSLASAATLFAGWLCATE